MTDEKIFICLWVRCRRGLHQREHRHSVSEDSKATLWFLFTVESVNEQCGGVYVSQGWKSTLNLAGWRQGIYDIWTDSSICINVIITSLLQYKLIDTQDLLGSIYSSPLYSTLLVSTLLYCIHLHFTLFFSTVFYSTSLHYFINLHSILLYSIPLNSTCLHSILLYSTLHY